MPTNKPRVTITMSDEQLERIEKYRFDHKFKNQTQAILSLIEDGFNFLSSKTDDPLKTGTEFPLKDLEKKYSKLDARGKDIVDTILEKEYQHSNKSVSPKKTYRVAAMGNSDVRVDEDTAKEIAKAAENAPNLADKGFL